MSRHIKNTACPKCREIGKDRQGNNLGEYEDGSAFCWNCGFYIHASTGGLYKQMVRGLGEKILHVEAPSFPLPDDSDTYIPAVARLWLGKYALTEYEIVTNRLLWSERTQQLIFPYFDKYGNLVGWQGRSCGSTNPGKSKWFTQGNVKELYYILPVRESYETIVLVEDIVSAIKVSRFVPCMPIFGSTAANRLKTLYNRTEGLVWWLDPNMKKKSLQEADKARSLGFKATQIWSELDPKEHSEEEIKKYLTESEMYGTINI